MIGRAAACIGQPELYRRWEWVNVKSAIQVLKNILILFLVFCVFVFSLSNLFEKSKKKREGKREC